MNREEKRGNDQRRPRKRKRMCVASAPFTMLCSDKCKPHRDSPFALDRYHPVPQVAPLADTLLRAADGLQLILSRITGQQRPTHFVGVRMTPAIISRLEVVQQRLVALEPVLPAVHLWLHIQYLLCLPSLFCVVFVRFRAT